MQEDKEVWLDMILLDYYSHKDKIITLKNMTDLANLY